MNASVTLNGNTIKEIKNGDYVLVKDSDYTLSEDGSKITFKNEYLQSLKASEDKYTFTISYNPLGKEYVEEEGNEAPTNTTIALTVSKAEGSVSNISDISKTYDGKAVEAPSFDTTNNKENVVVEYKLKDAEDDTYTTDAPVNAGTYVVRVTAKNNGDYTQAISTKEFTIAKATPEVVKAKANELTYAGKAQDLVTKAQSNGGTVLYKLDNTDWGTTLPQATDAGTYTVSYKVEGDENFEPVEEKVLTVVIAKKMVKVSGITASNKVYDGTTNVTLDTSNVVFDGKVEKDELTVSVNGVFDNQNVGSQKVVALSDLTLGGANRNYELDSNSQDTTTAAIIAKGVTVTVKDASKEVNKKDPKFTYTVSGLVGKETLTGITVTRKAGEKVGTYTIKATQKSGENLNYKVTFKNATFTITEADQSKLTPNQVTNLSLPILLAKGKGGNKEITLSWTKVSQATGYDIYWSNCDGKKAYQKLTTVKQNVLKTTHKKLNNANKYKYIIVSYKMVDGKKVYIAKSSCLHVAMKDTKLTNAKSIAVNKASISLAVGKSFTIKATTKLENSKKQPVLHAAQYRYCSTNKKVATVSSAGKIIAKAKGSCKVYVIANNGIYKTVTVTVK